MIGPIKLLNSLIMICSAVTSYQRHLYEIPIVPDVAFDVIYNIFLIHRSKNIGSEGC